MATFEHMPNFTMCLGPGCDSGQIHGGGDDQPIMTCTTCKFKTCFTHKLPHHAGMTCDEYDEDASRKRRIEEEAASEKHLREETKKCPNSDCAVPCVKVIGCDHITCRFANLDLVESTHDLCRSPMQAPMVLHLFCAIH
jgi:hypothetical protein